MLVSTLLIDRYVSKDEQRKVAKTVLLSQDIREESWIPEKSKYKLNEQEAADKAVKEVDLDDHWAFVIGHWNFFYWNDCQEWAFAILTSGKNG
jgi:hypothetical protein